MSWSTPRTWATSEVVTAANMNTYISDNLSFLTNFSNNTVATSETTTSTTYTDLTTSGPAVTITTGTKVLIGYGAAISNNTASDGAGISFAVSGATTSAAADSATRGLTATITSGTLNTDRLGRVDMFTGLTAGSNTFTLKYRATLGGTATFGNRFIWAMALPTA